MELKNLLFQVSQSERAEDDLRQRQGGRVHWDQQPSSIFLDVSTSEGKSADTQDCLMYVHRDVY